jgi:hypothetical protein
METIKSIIYDNWKVLVIIFCLFFILKSCQQEDKLELSNNKLKKEVKESIKKVRDLETINNQFYLKLEKLQNEKQKVKTEIIYIQNKAKSAIKNIVSLSTQEKAKFYQERYKTPIEVTKQGICLSDSISKKNIIELIEKDSCIDEIKLVKAELQIEERTVLLKDSVISNFSMSNVILKEVIHNQSRIIKDTEQSLIKQKLSKKIWVGLIILGASYLIIKK